MTRFPPASPGTRRLRLSLLSGLVLLWALLAVSQAQLTLDGSLGPKGPLPGPNYRIGAELGQIRGSNLFHSFDQFNVPAGGSATFTGPHTIANILSRVTGGHPSAIDGILRSEVAGANLYLLNPSGVLFGPNASLAVTGSFHVSTADYLRFTDGATFAANLGHESVLTVAPPAAFGFLGNTPAGITIQGSRLRVPAEHTLSVVGGDVTLRGPASSNAPTLAAASGRIQLASVASPGEVVFSPLELAPDLQVDSFARLGRMALSQGAWVTVGTAGDRNAGTIAVRGGQLMLSSGSTLSATTGGSGAGGRVVVTASTVSLMEEGRIEAGAAVGSRGDSGPIELQVGTLTLTDGGSISTTTGETGRGGPLIVSAREAIVITGRNRRGNPSRLSSTVRGSGAGGRVVVTTPRLSLDGGGTIRADSIGEGTAGTILLQVSDTFRSENGHVTTSAQRAGGGAIVLTAGHRVLLHNSELATSVRGGGSDAGNVTLDAPVVVAEDSQIVANALEGRGGNIGIRAEVFLADPASRVSASSELGISGTVAIQAPVTSLSGTLAPLPQAFVNVAALLPARCAARLSGGQASSLVLGGRDGLPAEPGGVLPSPLVLEERLVADPALTGALHRQKTAARFALLAAHKKGLPRLAGDCAQ